MRGATRALTLAISVAAILIASAPAARPQATELEGALARFRLEQAEARYPAGEWDQRDVLRLYGQVLACRTEAGGSWPENESFPDVVAELIAFARDADHELDRYARVDYDATLAFEQAGLIAEARAHLECVLELHEPGEAHLPLLATIAASYARACRELDTAGNELARASELLAALPEGPAKLEAGALLALERTTHWIAIGLAERGVAELERARVLVEDLALNDARLADALRADVLLDELNLANALDAPERALQALEDARAAPWYARLDSGRRREHVLREAAALADRARLEGSEPNEAVYLLAELLDDPDLARDEAQLARLLLADLELEVGSLDTAEYLLAEVRAQLEPEPNACSFDLPTRREIDLFALSGRLALRRGGSPQALERARAEAERGLSTMLVRWADAPQHDGGLAMLATRDRLRVAEVCIELELAAMDSPAGARAALELAGRLQAVGSLARALGAKAPSVEEVREHLLPPDGGLLVFVPGERRSYALAVDRSGVRAFALDAIQLWAPARRALAVELALAVRANRRTPALDACLAELEARLLPPAVSEHIGGWSELVIVGLAGIGYVPFELFRAGEREPLGRRVALSYAPSLPVGVHLARRARPVTSEPAPLWVLAAGDAPGFARVVEELDEIAFDASARAKLLAGLGRFPVELRVGRAANLDALAELGGSAALALQLIAHTAEAGRVERPRELLLAPDGAGRVRVSPARLETLRVPPFVALTACGAAEGVLRQGDDGRHHLAGALFVAGARAQLSSSVDQDFDAALELHGAFLEAFLGRGESPARALLAARRASHPDALLPYLVHLNGAGHTPFVTPIERHAPAGQLWALLVGVAMICALSRVLPHPRA